MTTAQLGSFQRWATASTRQNPLSTPRDSHARGSGRLTPAPARCVQVSDYTDATDVEDGDLEEDHGDTEPLLAAVSESDVSLTPADDSEDFVCPLLRLMPASKKIAVGTSPRESLALMGGGVALAAGARCEGAEHVASSLLPGWHQRRNLGATPPTHPRFLTSLPSPPLLHPLSLSRPRSLLSLPCCRAYCRSILQQVLLLPAATL